jgi:hypothetical protein
MCLIMYVVMYAILGLCYNVYCHEYDHDGRHNTL